MVCNEDGRCWRERGERRVIVREPSDSYGYAPRRERYIERRGYGDGGGIGIHAPASASESAPIATEKADNSLNTSKAAEKSAAFSDANSR